MAIQHQRGMRFMLLQHPVDGTRHGRHLLGIDALLVVLRSESRREQEIVPLAQRNIQRIGYNGKEIPAGRAASAFHKAEMTLRDTSIEREIKLAFAALVPPVAQQFAELRSCRNRLCSHLDFLLFARNRSAWA